MKKNEQGSPLNHSDQEVGFGAATTLLNPPDNGFFGSLQHREAAHRPQNENMIRGMV